MIRKKGLVMFKFRRNIEASKESGRKQMRKFVSGRVTSDRTSIGKEVLFPHLFSVRDFYETVLGVCLCPVPCVVAVRQQVASEPWLKAATGTE